MKSYQLLKKYTGKIMMMLMLVSTGIPLSASQGQYPEISRYFFSGDGKFTLYSQKNGRSFSGVYRSAPGVYDQKALSRIHRLFDAPCESSSMELSLRLIEFIDYLEDRLNQGAKITITSGYRKPKYNTMLREKGHLAAKASLHQYGMAADLKIEGVNAEALWNYVRNLNFGGAGYYHGEIVHIDVGPARSWDETTSGVGTGISDDNKLIGMVTDYDVYTPGMPVALRFIRMTAFPIHVKAEFSLLRGTNESENEPEQGMNFVPVFPGEKTGACLEFKNIDEMNHIKWTLPADLTPGRYRILASFCDDLWPDMPVQVQTPEFEIKLFE
jgi:uncharacterized protein YcbK (DUF882 family)